MVDFNSSFKSTAVIANRELSTWMSAVVRHSLSVFDSLSLLVQDIPAEGTKSSGLLSQI